MNHLCITVNWLDERYHGLLGRNGPPEWPPSPFRLFQALVAGVARSGELDADVGKSLEWLQSLAPPVILAPRMRRGQSITYYVPNNDGDKVPDRQNRLTGKTAQPTMILDPPRIHYLWAIPGDCLEAQGVIQASRRLSCLGWGIDMAYANGELVGDEQIGRLRGIRWLPKPDTLRDDGLLRVPTEDSLQDLRRAHLSALGRIEDGKPLRPVDKPERFDRVFYASAERPLGRPYFIFSLRASNGESYRYPHAKLVHIAGMTRCAAIKAMKAYPPEAIGGSDTETDSGRSQVLVGDTVNRDAVENWPFASAFGLELLAIELSGKMPQKTIKLIERALLQSGIEQRCQFTWSAQPIFRNCLTAHRYDRHKRPIGYYRPGHLETLTAVHLRITFECPVAGPLAVGAGRHCGLGVLAVRNEEND